MTGLGKEVESNFAQGDLQASVEGWGWDSEKGFLRFLDTRRQCLRLGVVCWGPHAAANVNQCLRMAVERWTLDDVIKPQK